MLVSLRNILHDYRRPHEIFYRSSVPSPCVIENIIYKEKFRYDMQDEFSIEFLYWLLVWKLLRIFLVLTTRKFFWVSCMFDTTIRIYCLNWPAIFNTREKTFDPISWAISICREFHAVHTHLRKFFFTSREWHTICDFVIHSKRIFSKKSMPKRSRESLVGCSPIAKPTTFQSHFTKNFTDGRQKPPLEICCYIIRLK